MDDKYVREKISYLMEERGTTIPQLADALNVSQFVVYHWFDRGTKSFLPLLGSIAKYFNVSVDYLVGREPDFNVDVEVCECMMELRSRPEMRELFKAAKSASKSDIVAATKIIEALKQRNE